MLTPGNYRFAGKYTGEVVGPRGLRWRVFCAGAAAKPIGESSMIGGVVSAWQDVDFSFAVPAADCRAQYVQLDLDARMASEQLVTGSMMFDQLQISRQGVSRPAGDRVN
jgi:hypothetical protein